ncbi:hypothetical protein [Castellaniella sp.]|nr:hypothetical protein [Castellaniella sp.]
MWRHEFLARAVAVSDDLLRVVFMRLGEEVQEAAFDGEEDGPAVSCTVH